MTAIATLGITTMRVMVKERIETAIGYTCGQSGKLSVEGFYCLVFADDLTIIV